MCMYTCSCSGEAPFTLRFEPPAARGHPPAARGQPLRTNPLTNLFPDVDVELLDEVKDAHKLEHACTRLWLCVFSS
jgi:hypothetical protein